MKNEREQTTRRSRCARRPIVDDRTRVFLCDPSHVDRANVEQFVADRFRDEYRAEVAAFLPTLMGIASASGALIGAIGVREARAGASLYLESYLDAPIETVLSAETGRSIERAAIAEIGNLASDAPGGGRILVTAFAHYLRALGLDWAVFTATRPLRNSFERLGVQLVDLGAASAARLSDDGASWGSYYSLDPRVSAVLIDDVCRLARTNRRFAGPMAPVRRAATRVGVDRRLAARAA
jgi:hypothetical protein